MQLPYMLAPGVLSRILDKITVAQQPERFTQDFLGSKLGFDGGSARPAIPFFKRIGLLASDGSPTQLYARFRNPSERGRAMAEALKIGYRNLFERNEYANSLNKDKLKNLVVEITGLEPDHQTVKAVTACFTTLNQIADFESNERAEIVPTLPAQQTETNNNKPHSPTATPNGERLGLNLAHTINLNLPETRDIEVFNSIFRSLRENLLKGNS